MGRNAFWPRHIRGKLRTRTQELHQVASWFHSMQQQAHTKGIAKLQYLHKTWWNCWTLRWQLVTLGLWWSPRAITCCLRERSLEEVPLEHHLHDCEMEICDGHLSICFPIGHGLLVPWRLWNLPRPRTMWNRTERIEKQLLVGLTYRKTFANHIESTLEIRYILDMRYYEILL